MDNKDVIVTMCNDGYADFCMNWLQSVKSVGLEKSVVVFTYGELAFAKISATGCEVIRCEDILNDYLEIKTDQVLLSEDGWCEITLMKLMCVGHLLGRGNNVLHSDGDIVLLNPDILNHIKKLAENVDAVFQMERVKGPDCINSGFYYIKSNKRTQNLLHISDDTDVCCYGNDQNLLNLRVFFASQNYRNKRLAKCYRGLRECLKNGKWDIGKSLGLTWKPLPMNMYPWGKLWLSKRYQRRYQKKKILPNMVHYNYIISGNSKIEVMKKYGHWYLEQ